jgi:anti-anti-sigma factor
LEAKLTSLRGDGVSAVVLDLGGVPYVDSAGLAALVRIRNHFRDREGAVVLRSCQPTVRHALQITRLARLFDLES